MKYFCGCGQAATHELNFPNLDGYYGREETWTPTCEEHIQEAFENAEDHNSYAVNLESGGAVIVNCREIV